jgi:hypothetical protein
MPTATTYLRTALSLARLSGCSLTDAEVLTLVRRVAERFGVEADALVLEVVR